jgi:hypothetical protein
MYVNTGQRWHHSRVFERYHKGVAREMDGGRFYEIRHENRG